MIAMILTYILTYINCIDYVMVPEKMLDLRILISPRLANVVVAGNLPSGLTKLKTCHQLGYHMVSPLDDKHVPQTPARKPFRHYIYI